ncbi:MAG: hypothetical protein KDB80_10235 [Planctomycetes bacterium]|nr:hypothetical protein [Planctomycetota bacterium]
MAGDLSRERRTNLIVPNEVRIGEAHEEFLVGERSKVRKRGLADRSPLEDDSNRIALGIRDSERDLDATCFVRIRQPLFDLDCDE